MRLIIRADDVGYTNVHNLGTWKVIEQGIATAADLMLDTPGAEDAMTRLKSYPWISVGWHTHFWGSPVADPEKVPSLVAENGHFRSDLTTAEDVSAEEVLLELRTELNRCLDIMGNVPAYCASTYPETTPFGRAMAQINREYGIITNFMGQGGTMKLPSFLKLPPDAELQMDRSAFAPKPVDERWKDRKIFSSTNGGGHSPTDLLADAVATDPVKDFLDGADELLAHDDYTWFTAWHPGYLDHYVIREGDHGFAAKNFLLSRPIDAEALCDQRLKDWIAEKGIELVNFHDALFGTRQYQNHLRSIGSPLAIL